MSLSWGERRARFVTLRAAEPGLMLREIAERLGENPMAVSGFKWSMMVDTNPAALPVIELLLNTTLTQTQIIQASGMTSRYVGLIRSHLLATGRLESRKAEGSRTKHNLDWAVRQARAFLTANPGATNDEINAGRGRGERVSIDAITTVRQELGLHSGRDARIVKFLVIRASRAAGVTLEELGALLGVSRERIRQFEVAADKHFGSAT